MRLDPALIPRFTPVMNSTKCKACGLSNFPNEPNCRRCGGNLYGSGSASANTSFSFGRYLPLVIVAGIIGAGYYFYTGSNDKVEQTNMNEAHKITVQKPDDSQGLSRTEYDQRRAANVGDAIKQNPGLEAQKKQQEETQRIMQQVTNTSR